MSEFEDDVWAVSSFGGTYTMIEHAIQMLELNEFTDGEIAAFAQYSTPLQMRLRLNLIALFDTLRDSVVALDQRLQELAELQGAPA